MYFEKKFFNKEKEFLKEAHNLHQKTIKSVKCEFTFFKRKKTDCNNCKQVEQKDIKKLRI